MARFVLRRLASGLIVLLVITLLSFLAQDVALHTRSNQRTPLSEVAISVLRDTAAMWRGLASGDLGTYTQSNRRFYSPDTKAVSELLGEYLLNSVALLALAMTLGGLLGGLCGALAAASRRRSVSLALLLASVVGISTPSFFLGMLLQYLEISIHRATGLRLVPVGGYGWDSHLILPVAVLAARPVAQVARLTYVRVEAILDEDFVRTARAKGLSRRAVWAVHVIPNVAGTVLTAMGTSLRFSLSSLPVVEFLFGWPGAGRAMLDMLRTFQSQGATALILVLGAIFVAANIGLDILYQVLDPRLRQSEADLRVGARWWEWFASLFDGLWRALTLRRWRERRQLAQERTLTLRRHARGAGAGPGSADNDAQLRRQARRRAWMRAIAGNPALLCGAVLGVGLLALVIAGPAWAPHDPHQFATLLLIDGKPVTPPVAPTLTYPFGSDAQGRDILSLILVGARRTLTIAFFAVIARLLIGGALGFVAGWFSGSRLDRAIMAAAETLAAFPSLLLAMLLVYAVGIRQGITSFVIALALVGWGEVMQTVRHQVIGIKPMAYVESAVAAGLSEGQILSAHVLPNVWPTMVSLGFLEMGGVLMLLGELGFLGVFIGGGLAYDQPDGLPPVFYYDIPEWSVMLSSSWRTFRSYPWATLYPALAFFVAIMGFTFLGEGLRQLTERLTLSLRSLFNRYTLALAALITLGVGWMFQSTGFYARFAPSAASFDAIRALDDVGVLASREMAGRLSGSADADRAAAWIAEQFEALGLQPGGHDLTYYQTFVDSYRDLTAMPTLVLHGPDGQEITAEYGRDFVRDVGRYDIGGIGRGDVQIMANTLSRYQLPQAFAASFGLPLAEITRSDRIVLRLSRSSLDSLWNLGHSGVMTLRQQSLDGSRYELLAVGERSVGESRPSIVVGQDIVERMLATSGQTVGSLVARLPASGQEGVLYWPTGWTAEISIPTAYRQGEGRNIIAYWPGQDVNLDAEMVVVAAYYDGLGSLPDGTLYPGANDNASGVATMLEMVRTLRSADFAPRRTILFVAWSGGERHEPVDFPFFLKAARGFEQSYKIVAGLEIEGVGAGEGSSMVVWRTSRERLTDVLQKAARQVNAPLSTRAQGLHADTDMWTAPSLGTPAAVISWSGSDALAHIPGDTLQALDPAKLAHVGRTVTLATMVLSSDPAY